MEKSDKNNTKPPNVWQVYEARKRQILRRNLPYNEYEKAIRQLVKELRL